MDGLLLDHLEAQTRYSNLVYSLKMYSSSASRCSIENGTISANAEWITTAFMLAYSSEALDGRLEMPRFTCVTALKISTNFFKSESGVFPFRIRRYCAVKYIDTARYTVSSIEPNGRWNRTIGRSLSITGQALVTIYIPMIELRPFCNVVAFS